MLAARIKEVRTATGLNKTAFGRLMSVSHTAVSQWESGEVKTLQHKTLITMEEKTGFRAEWISSGKGPKFVEATGNSPGIREMAEGYDFRPMCSIVSVIEWADLMSDEKLNFSDSPRIVIPKAEAEDCYCLVINSNSMISDSAVSYPPGGTIVVSPSPECHPAIGDDVIARLSDGSVIFRRLSADGSMLYLEALNKNYPPIREEFAVLGKVVGVWFEVGN